MLMPFQGGDLGALRHLLRLVELDAVQLAGSRRRVEPALADVCVAAAAASDLRRAEDELWRAIEAITRAVAQLETADRPPVASPPPTTTAPEKPPPTCESLEQDIGVALDVFIRRLHQAREDARNLRFTQPTGEFSYGGHVDQAAGWQRRMKRKLKLRGKLDGCRDSLTIQVARLYVELDLRKELSWPGAAAVAAHARHRGWHLDLGPVAKVAGGAAAAAGAVIAAGRAVAGAAAEAAPALGL